MVWAKALARSAARTPQRRRNGAPRGAAWSERIARQKEQAALSRRAVPLFFFEEGILSKLGRLGAARTMELTPMNDFQKNDFQMNDSPQQENAKEPPKESPQELAKHRARAARLAGEEIRARIRGLSHKMLDGIEHILDRLADDRALPTPPVEVAR